MSRYLTLIFLGLTLLFLSCHKEGCTDFLALNYDPEADQSDFSCEYTGKVTFWMTVETKDALILSGHEKLYFKLDGELLDSATTSTMGASSGDCSFATSKTFSRNYVGNTERSYTYEVRGLGMSLIQKGFVTIETGDCTVVKIL